MQDKSSKGDIGLALIHGAGLGKWIWEDMLTHLDSPYLCADFPLRDKNQDRSKLGLKNYVDHVYEAVDKWSVPKVIVVAHSLGGVVALDLSQKLNGRLAGFVAISAAIPKNGGSFLSCLPFPQKTIMGIALRILGTQPPASAIKQSLGSDLDDKQAQKVADKFVPEPRKIYFDKVTANPPEVPSLFVKLTDDKEFSVTIQDKMISNLSAKDVIEIRSGHLPMISKPKELANILNDFRASLQNNE